MNPLSRRMLHVVCLISLSTALHAQFYKLHDAEIGVSATGEFTTTISAPTYLPAAQEQPSGPPQAKCFTAQDVVHGNHIMGCTNATTQTLDGMGLLEPDTTDAPGVLVTLRDRPERWAEIEVNYQYTKFSERFFDVPGQTTTTDAVFVPTNMQEATAAYILPFHPISKIKPFASVGGGALFFSPIVSASGGTPSQSQWRGTGLVEVGIDMQTVSRLGFRLGARDLLYRAPSFGMQPAGSTWVSTEEPYAGVYVKLSRGN